MDLLQAAPFQNMYPRPFVKEDQSAEIVMQQMDQQYAPLHLVTMVSKHGTPQQARNAKDSDLLTKERLCRALSMFEVVMQKLKDILMREEEVRSFVGQEGSSPSLFGGLVNFVPLFGHKGFCLLKDFFFFWFGNSNHI